MSAEMRTRRVLVVVHGARLTGELADRVADRAGAGAAARVVVPSVASSRPSDWLADEVDADGAERRLQAALGALRARGVTASGMLGDADPLRAIEDALVGFAPDEILFVTGRAADWGESERALWRARRRVGGRVSHVDLSDEGVAETERLLYACPAASAERIGAGEGFADAAVDGLGAGVLLVDRAGEAVLSDESLGIVAVEVPVDLLPGHEVGREGRGRRYLIPADTLNRAGTVLGPVA
jgi:hypothetical protein